MRLRTWTRLMVVLLALGCLWGAFRLGDTDRANTLAAGAVSVLVVVVHDMAKHNDPNDKDNQE